MKGQKGNRAGRALVYMLALCFSHSAARAELNLLPTEAVCLDLGPREQVLAVRAVRGDPTKIMVLLGDQRGTETIARQYFTTGLRDESFTELRRPSIISLTENPDGSWLVLENARPALKKISATGTLDPTFGVWVSIASTLAVLSDGRFYANQVGGTAAARTVIRYLPDGTVDETFASPVFDRNPTEMAVSADGHVYLAGLMFNTPFTRVNGVPRNGFVKIRTDGSVDPEFVTSTRPLWIRTYGNEIYAAFDPGATGDQRLMRLRENGIADNSFTPFSAIEPSLFRDSQGRFYSPTPEQASRLYRYLNDGTRDDSYISGVGTIGRYEGRALLLNDDELLTLSSHATVNDAVVRCGGYLRNLTGRPRPYWLARVRISGETRLRLVPLVIAKGSGKFSPTIAVADEQGAETGTANTIARTGPTGEAAVFRFKSRSGSAIEGIDFQPGEGELRFGPGEDRAILNLRAINDAEPELNEEFFVDFWNERQEFVCSIQAMATSDDPGLALNGLQRLEQMKWRIPKITGGASWNFLSSGDLGLWDSYPTVDPASDGSDLVYLIEFDTAGGPMRFFQAQQRP